MVYTKKISLKNIWGAAWHVACGILVPQPGKEPTPLH